MQGAESNNATNRLPPFYGGSEGQAVERRVKKWEKRGKALEAKKGKRAPDGNYLYVNPHS